MPSLLPLVLRAAQLPWGDAVRIVANLDKVATTVVKWHDKTKARKQREPQQGSGEERDSISGLRSSMASLNVRKFRAEVAELRERLGEMEGSVTSQAESIEEIAKRADILLEGFQSMLARTIMLSWAVAATVLVAIAALALTLFR